MSAPAATLTKLLAWRPGGYLRASGALFGWLAVRTAAQTALFVLVARTLGAEGYGVIIAVTAIAGFFSCAAMGATSVLVREGARQPNRLPELIGDLLRVWVVTTPIFCLLAVVTCWLLLSNALPISALIAITLAEVACVSVIDGVGRLHQSQGHISKMGGIFGGLILARLVTFVLVLPFETWNVENWAWGYFLSTACYLAGLVWVERGLVLQPQFSAASIGDLIRRSFPFTCYNMAYKAHGEINKPTLAHLVGFQSAGTFSAAHRSTDLVTFPALALIESLVPRVYKATYPLKTAAKLGLAPVVMAVVGGVFMFCAAGWLPIILGSSYHNSVPLTQALAALPVFLVVRITLGSVMVAINIQHLFPLLHSLGLIIHIAMLWVLVPAMGAPGAVVAAYILELSLIMSQLWAIYRFGTSPSGRPIETDDTVKPYTIS